MLSTDRNEKLLFIQAYNFWLAYKVYKNVVKKHHSGLIKPLTDVVCLCQISRRTLKSCINNTEILKQIL